MEQVGRPRVFRPSLPSIVVMVVVAAAAADDAAAAAAADDDAPGIDACRGHCGCGCLRWRCLLVVVGPGLRCCSATSKGVSLWGRERKERPYLTVGPVLLQSGADSLISAGYDPSYGARPLRRCVLCPEDGDDDDSHDGHDGYD